MRGVLALLRQELDHLLHGIANLHTDHGIHGYPPPARGEEGPRR
jgi:hypothetical protein